MQNAANYGLKERKNVYFPAGVYLVTEPIVLEENFSEELSKRQSWIKLYGVGYSSWEVQYSGSVIRGQGIPKGRAALELIGHHNAAAVQIELDTLTVHVPVDGANVKGSCAMILGDSWHSLIRRCRFIGSHGVALKCGFNSSTYAMINTKFEQCYLRALDVDGFSVLSYDLLVSGKQAGYDNISFENCLFFNTTYLSCVTSYLENCMWVVDVEKRNPVTYTSDYEIEALQGETIQFGAALYLAGGMCTLRNGYFEDIGYGIIMQPTRYGSYLHATLETCLFHGLCNRRDESGNRLTANAALWIKGNVYQTGRVDYVSLTGCQFDDEAYFTDAEIIDDYAINLNVVDSSRPIRIRRGERTIPSGKMIRTHVSNFNRGYGKAEKEVWFYNSKAFTSRGGRMRQVLTDLKQITIDRLCRVIKIDVYYKGTFESTFFGVGILRNDTVINYYNFIVPDSVHGTLSVEEDEDGRCCHVSLSYIPQVTNVDFQSGDILGLDCYGTLSEVDLEKTIFIKVTLEY